MTKQRADLGFGDELESFDAAEWTPKPADRAASRPKQSPEARQIAEASGFRSREPVATPAPSRDRRRRTGRNAQLNIKATPETVEAFYAIADAQNWGLGETLEHAVALLQKQYPE